MIAQKLREEIEAYLSKYYVSREETDSYVPKVDLPDVKFSRRVDENALQKHQKRKGIFSKRTDAVEACQAIPQLYFNEAELKTLLGELDDDFTVSLKRTIEFKHMSDSEVYNAAQISRQLFHNILYKEGYKPGKLTILALICALRLTVGEGDALLKKAGYAFSNSSKLDLIVKYCLDHGIYSVMTINEILYEYDQPLLGSGQV